MSGLGTGMAIQNFPLSGADDLGGALPALSSQQISAWANTQTHTHKHTNKAPIESDCVRAAQLCLVSRRNYVYVCMYIGEAMIHRRFGESKSQSSAAKPKAKDKADGQVFCYSLTFSSRMLRKSFANS